MQGPKSGYACLGPCAHICHTWGLSAEWDVLLRHTLLGHHSIRWGILPSVALLSFVTIDWWLRLHVGYLTQPPLYRVRHTPKCFLTQLCRHRLGAAFPSRLLTPPLPGDYVSPLAGSISVDEGLSLHVSLLSFVATPYSAPASSTRGLHLRAGCLRRQLVTSSPCRSATSLPNGSDYVSKPDAFASTSDTIPPLWDDYSDDHSDKHLVTWYPLNNLGVEYLASLTSSGWRNQLQSLHQA